MNGWREIALCELADLSGGFAFKSEDYAPAGRFVLRTLNIREDGSVSREDAVYLPEDSCSQYSRFELQPHDTLFVMVGATLGKVGYVRESDLPALLNQNMWFIRAKPEVADPRFVQYAFRHAAKASLAWASGSARDFVRRDDYRNLQVPAPPLPEQRAIAAVLGALDDKIELNRRMNETLEALAQTLFKSWFVDATANGLPKSWTTRALYECADYINGAAFRNEHFTPERQGLPVIKIGELKDGITAQTRFTELEREPKYRIASGDILFSWSGSPDTSIDTFVWTGGDGWLNQHIFKIHFKRPIEKFFVYYLLRHYNPEFIEIARNKQTTGLGHVTAGDLKRLQTAFPPDDVLEEFNCAAEPLFQKVYSNMQESRTLAALRDALLPKLLSGELRVPASMQKEAS